ncbi:MAG: S8 family serine peptidase [Polyangiaceae bacterium]|nr:S8 family serine peptidase [Polyangiaceae bacterium]
MLRRRVHIVAASFALLLAVASSARANAQSPIPTNPARGAAPGSFQMGKISGALPLYFMRRPSADGTGKILGAASEAPVLISLVAPPSPKDLADLRAAGAVVERRNDGSPRGIGNTVAAWLPADRAKNVAALPQVTRIALDGSPFNSPRPLNKTAAEIQALDVWRQADPAGNLKLTGAGVTVCDIDSGIDPFHPLFFRADGGYYSWIDENADGILTPGVDRIDLGNGREPSVIRVLDSPVLAYWDTQKPLFGSADPAFRAGMDWLYADEDASFAREFGPDAGFTEQDPTFGERILVADDVNRNGIIDAGEKLVALGTSKILAYRLNKKVYRRGQNLILAPPSEEASHGTGASGVMVGGNIGLTKLVGVAPDADLVMASDTDGTSPAVLTDFCIDQGARVVLHEYAPWVGYHLDGSSTTEELIDTSSAKDVVHINPAGNLSRSQKLFKREIPSGESTDIAVEAPKNSPYGDFTYLGLSILWRDPSRNLALTLEDPTGYQRPVSPQPTEIIFEGWGSTELSLYAFREDSSRGTARVDIFVWNQGGSPARIEPGTWTLRATEPSPKDTPALEIIAYAIDDRSGWGKGIHFPEHASEDHLVGFPGTADFGIAVAAYTGHGFFGGVPGERADYSGRGRRIDGKSILWIAAPDDPITSNYIEGTQAPYVVYGGTSGASPHVAGAAALLIQADPSRTGRDVREAIKAGALADETVGAAPNDDYGYGKLRIHRSLTGEDPPAGSAPILKIARARATAGSEAAIEIGAFDADEPAESLILDIDRDYDGVFDERLMEPMIRASFDSPGTFVSKVRATDSTGRQSVALAVVDVLDAPANPLADPALVAAGGCAHAAGGGGAWPAFGAVLAALGLRRSRRGSAAARVQAPRTKAR